MAGVHKFLWPNIIRNISFPWDAVASFKTAIIFIVTFARDINSDNVLYRRSIYS